MPDDKKKQSLCRNVFKSGNVISQEQFTKKWIELINGMEKNKTMYIPK